MLEKSIKGKGVCCTEVVVLIKGEGVCCTEVVAGVDSNVLIYEYDGRNMIH